MAAICGAVDDSSGSGSGSVAACYVLTYILQMLYFVCIGYTFILFT